MDKVGALLKGIGIGILICATVGLGITTYFLFTRVNSLEKQVSSLQSTVNQNVDVVNTNAKALRELQTGYTQYVQSNNQKWTVLYEGLPELGKYLDQNAANFNSLVKTFNDNVAIDNQKWAALNDYLSKPTGSAGLTAEQLQIIRSLLLLMK